jgi:prickle
MFKIKNNLLYEKRTFFSSSFQCQKSIDSGTICIYAERIGRNTFWHPQCFTCIQCKEFLINLIYFSKDGLLYCGRHHAELYKPRCTACDEVCKTN